MCAGYWSIKQARLKCSYCGKISFWKDLQTHYGDYGSMAVYSLGQICEPITDVKKGTLSKKNGFIGVCPKCKRYENFGATIEDGAITKIY